MGLKHAKIDTIPDFTQADLNAAISKGIYPPGTLLADIVLPSDWNADHIIDGDLIYPRETTPNTAGTDWALQAQSATSGSTNKDGGDLVLSAGVSTGTGTSKVFVKASAPITTGPIGSLVLDPASDPGWSIGEIADENYQGGGAQIQVTAVDGSGVPTAVTIINPGSNYNPNDLLVFADAGATKYIYILSFTITGSADNTPKTVIEAQGRGQVIINPDYADPEATDISTVVIAKSPTRPYDPATLDEKALALWDPDYPELFASISWQGGFKGVGFTAEAPPPYMGSSYGAYINVVNGSITNTDVNRNILSSIDVNGSFTTTNNVITPHGSFGYQQNIIQYSEDFTQPVWVKTNATVTGNAVAGPNGVSLADQIDFTTSTGSVRQTVRIPTIGPYCPSIWVRADSGTFDIGYGWVGASFGSQTITTTWQRLTFSAGTTLSGAATFSIEANGATGRIYVFGAQGNAGLTPYAYTPTLDGAITAVTQGSSSVGSNNFFQQPTGFGVIKPTNPIDVFGKVSGAPYRRPGFAPTVTRSAGGSVDVGTHSWKFTYVTALGETTPSDTSAVGTATSTQKTFTLSVPIGPSGVTARKIYRTVAGNTGNWKLVATIADNTTTSYVDTTADAGLGADAPTTNNTGTLSLAVNGSTKLTLTDDGRVYGTSLHNNAGSVTGTTNQYIASGTYTPTLTNVANLAASTAYAAQWIRVGNVLTVSGKVDVDPTLAATSTQLGISLPIASNLTSAEQCSGTAFAPAIAGQGAAILGDTTNDRAQMQWLSGDITNQPMHYTFSYVVL